MLCVLFAFIFYIFSMIFIGAFFYNKSKNISDFFIGGRKLNHWVAAISTQASDMSGWLLMGLPGAVYISGIKKSWIAIGLAIGTLLNWLLVAKRLRRFSIIFNNAITIPEYIHNRCDDKKNILQIISAVFIIIFFIIYIASAFVASGVLFSQIFNLNYKHALLIGAVLIFIYTSLGGFLAVCWTDLIQGIMMLCAVILIPAIAFFKIKNLNQVPHDFLNLFESNQTNNIISDLAWGLGYFGMPHILLKFMAIKSDKNIRPSIIIAMTWVIISIFFAIMIGLIGFIFTPNLTNSETVFINMTKKIFINSHASNLNLFIGGLFLCAILAAIMSTADSQILVTSSAITNDLLNFFLKNSKPKKIIFTSRISLFVIAFIAYLIALNPESNIMQLVSYAWAGFGSVFGPLILISLYWQKINFYGALAGMISGGVTVFIWEYNFSISTKIYSLIPGFLISCIAIIIFSLLTQKPSNIISHKFSEATKFTYKI